MFLDSMVHHAEMPLTAREQDRLSPQRRKTFKSSPKSGELLCRFIDYTWVRCLTSSAFLRSCSETRAEKPKLASAFANCFALHSQSAQPIEIRRRFSFLLPPLFAPGRCAASLFKAVVMSFRGVTAAFDLVRVAEPSGV